MAVVPMLLIFKEPDLGTALIFLPVLLTMLLIAGARVKYLLMFISSGLACAPLLWFFLKDYQRTGSWCS
jgi:rod shape determining protein RodA